MKVHINHTPVETAPQSTLADLLMQEGIAADGIAVAIDNKVVPRAEWRTTLLREEAKITVIRAVCGG